jgi:hypothetical protein
MRNATHPHIQKTKNKISPQKTKEVSHFPTQKHKTVQWREADKVKIYHPSQPVSQSFTRQTNNNPFAPSDHHSKLTFFQYALPPSPPPHYILQPQAPSQFYHTHNTGLYTYQPQCQTGSTIPSQNPFSTPDTTHTQFHYLTHSQHNPITYSNPFRTFPLVPNPNPNKN